MKKRRQAMENKLAMSKENETQTHRQAVENKLAMSQQNETQTPVSMCIGNCKELSTCTPASWF